MVEDKLPLHLMARQVEHRPLSPSLTMHIRDIARRTGIRLKGYKSNAKHLNSDKLQSGIDQL